MKNGLVTPTLVVDLSGIAELKSIQAAADGGLRIGAAVSARTLETDQRVRSAYHALSDGAAVVGSLQVRNLATLGGIRNAAPSADMAPPLLVLDAIAVVAGDGRAGSRWRNLPWGAPHRAAAR